MTTENNQQVVTEEAGTSIAVRSTQEMLSQQFGDLSSKSFEERVKLLERYTKITSDPDYDLSELLTKDFQIVDALFHYVTLTNDQTGQTNEAPRCVFITPNDETIACVSESAMRFVQTLQFTLPFPLPQPITINCTEVKTRRGFRTFNFKIKG